MPAAPQGGGQGSGDGSYDLLWIIAALMIAVAAIWYLFSSQLIVFYLSIKIFELDGLSLIASLFNYPFYFEPLKQALIVAKSNAANISFSTLVTAGSSVGMWLRIPLAVLLLILAIFVYWASTTRAYKRKYTMKEFAKLESENWPQITPVVNLDLIKTDIDTGPWAMAITPMQFCKKYKLLEEVRPQRTRRYESKRMG